MKLQELRDSVSSIEFMTVDYDNDIDFYPLLEQAEKLITKRGMNLLRNDEISDIAVLDDQVVGVLYNGVYDNEMTSSIVVDEKFGRMGIAKRLFDRIPFDVYPQVDTHVCEVLPPYTMEPFLKKNGYTFEEQDRDIKIYKKSIENSWF